LNKGKAIGSEPVIARRDDHLDSGIMGSS